MDEGEDLTGLGLGGNELCKLDYVLQDAVASGADVLMSGGVVQSNNLSQVAAAAAKLGIECHLAVYHGRLAPQAADRHADGGRREIVLTRCCEGQKDWSLWTL
jgi:1-aminocyclopropane-1-carboxylate deaminase/D-cysteine desulfhydrase-like pyridoxal-dependent ACC family enzyme